MLALRFKSSRLLPELFSKHQKSLLSRINFSSSNGGGDTETKTRKQLKFNVDKFGELSVRDVASCNFSITPVDPQLHPDQKLAFVDVPDGAGLKIGCSENHLKVRREGKLFNVPECYLSTCDIAIPIKYNVSASVDGWSGIKLKDLQNDRVMITSDIGNCSISNLQSKGISISTAGGKITSEDFVHGNAFFKTRQSGSVSLNKILSQYFDVKTDRGAINVKSLYSVHSKISTKRGNIRIGNAHKNVEVRIVYRGNLIIDSLDGNLSASVNAGNVDVFVCRTDGVDIHVNSGDIELKLSTALNAQLDLRGNSVTIDEGVQLSNMTSSSSDDSTTISGDLVQEGGEKPAVIRAHTKEGSVTLRLQSWIDSVKVTDDSDK